MRGIIVFILIITSSLTLRGQTFNISLSPTHSQKLNKYKTGHKRMLKYYKFYRADSVKEVKARLKKSKKVWDSLLQVEKITAKIDKRLLSVKDKAKYVDSIQRNYKDLKILAEADTTRIAKRRAIKQIKQINRNEVTAGKSFMERISIGGNFNIISTKPVSIDASPTIAYKLKTTWNVGLGLNYRSTFGDSIIHYSSRISNTNSSLRVFSNLDVFRNFFLNTEYERTDFLKAVEEKPAGLRNNYFGGLGKKLLIHPKIFMVVTALYRFNDKSQFYANRFQMRWVSIKRPWLPEKETLLRAINLQFSGHKFVYEVAKYILTMVS